MMMNKNATPWYVVMEGGRERGKERECAWSVGFARKEEQKRQLRRRHCNPIVPQRVYCLFGEHCRMGLE